MSAPSTNHGKSSKREDLNKLSESQIIKQCKNKEFCLIDDLRYQNEYEALITNGFKIIQMTISDDLQERRIKEVYPNNYKDHLINRNHASELNIFSWLDGVGPHLTIDSSLPFDSKKEILNSFIKK